MSTISVSDLKKKPAKQWLKSARKEDLVVTSKGQPVAVLLRIASASVESTCVLLRSVRALQAQAALQEAAVTNGAANLSLSDIDAEIAAPVAPVVPESVPIMLTAKARQIPEWTIDRYGLCAPLQASPVFSTQPMQTVSLFPWARPDCASHLFQPSVPRRLPIGGKRRSNSPVTARRFGAW